jgi:hypothetical protein
MRSAQGRKMTSQLAAATAQIIEVLVPLNSDERTRVFKAALTLLGDSAAAASSSSRFSKDDIQDASDGPLEASAQALSWMKKNSITRQELENYFHFDRGRAAPIALPGNRSTNKEKTANTYLMAGLAALFNDSEASFQDAATRGLCRHFGCYDGPNHVANLKAIGDKISGSKITGWKLTAAGLTAAAQLIKE